jgi:hypothetical protein
MKLNVFTVFLLIVLLQPRVCFAGFGEDTGKGAATVLVKGAQEVADKALPALAAAATTLTAGAESFGAKFGTEALALVGKGIWVATPYVVVGGVVVYVGYRTYKQWYPTPEEAALAEKWKVEKYKAQQEKIKLKLEYEFKKQLSKNLTTPRDKTGLPLACQEIAAQLAIAAGQECVDEILKNFNARSIQLQAILVQE